MYQNIICIIINVSPTLLVVFMTTFYHIVQSTTIYHDSSMMYVYNGAGIGSVPKKIVNIVKRIKNILTYILYN